MIAVMIKGKFEESALLALSCTFRGIDRRRSAARAIASVLVTRQFA